MKTERLYMLYVMNETTGEKVYLTNTPESHRVCCVIKSKQSARTINRVQFEEVN